MPANIIILNKEFGKCSLAVTNGNSWESRVRESKRIGYKSAAPQCQNAIKENKRQREKDYPVHPATRFCTVYHS